EEHRNLATNPSFEATSGTVEVRRNLVRNPLGASAGSIAEWARRAPSSSDVPAWANGRLEVEVTQASGGVYAILGPATGSVISASALLQAPVGNRARLWVYDATEAAWLGAGPQTPTDGTEVRVTLDA